MVALPVAPFPFSVLKKLSPLIRNWLKSLDLAKTTLLLTIFFFEESASTHKPSKGWEAEELLVINGRRGFFGPVLLEV
uniref:Uncharacterized protein n=1 Tax=Salix viminalis TaxID=40686 RepID=A0A6N2MWK6_SALVM